MISLSYLDFFRRCVENVKRSGKTINSSNSGGSFLLNSAVESR
jgi:hypothetical protein